MRAVINPLFVVNVSLGRGSRRSKVGYINREGATAISA